MGAILYQIILQGGSGTQATGLDVLPTAAPMRMMAASQLAASQLGARQLPFPAPGPSPALGFVAAAVPGRPSPAGVADTAPPGFGSSAGAANAEIAAAHKSALGAEPTHEYLAAGLDRPPSPGNQCAPKRHRMLSGPQGAEDVESSESPSRGGGGQHIIISDGMHPMRPLTNLR